MRVLPPRLQVTIPGLLLAVLLALAPTRGARADWPQILGPNRDGAADSGELPALLPESPRPRWSFPAGQGYAGPAVAADAVYLFDRLEDEERLVKLDRATGEVRWQKRFPTSYRGGVDPDAGPRSVPTVHESNVLVLGPGGALRCLDTADGRQRWSHDLRQEFGGKEGYFGMGSSPLVVGDRVLVNVGGADGAGVVAFKLSDGEPIWKSAPDDASYSSPVLWKVAAEPLAVFVTRLNLQVLEPATGRVVFRQAFGARGPTVNAAAPVVVGDHLFLTSSYGVGAMLIRWNGADSSVVWRNDDSLSSQYNTPVLHEGYLYGIHGREDVGQAELRCIEAMTGRVAWSVPDFGVAHLIRVGDRMLILKVDGTLIASPLDPQRFGGEEAGATARVSQHTTRSLPAFSGGQLFFRDHQGGVGALMCIDLNP